MQARNACKTGDKSLNESNIITPLVVGYAKSVNSSGLMKVGNYLRKNNIIFKTTKM